ncbi:hypothetical protein F6X68_06645 [Micromonospora sp. AMSO12t]|uniref:hypothetical protein n=1 Tax=Micromonospora sp. AMSO12t TaxID=2650410 RepID=UPI00124BB8D6|nr:hypothetical protein [Micromonospora sp. AMSO12t]KAB1160981.1 hypothetical protein F6X68_06645 [Micromonospora sp. AMSO12t]
MPNACRFCGTTNRQITKEHVWPDWLREYLPALRQYGHIERWNSAGGRQQWQQPVLTATVRVFCGACNNGWMSQLEDAAKRIVGPMVVGNAVKLDANAQQTVANWVALKGLVAAQTSSVEQPIPESHYRRVYHLKGAPPNTMRVWIGRRLNLADPNWPRRAQLFGAHFIPVTDKLPVFPVPPDFERYRSEGGVFNATIFQVGHFFALALQHDWPGLRARPNPGSAAAGALRPIWPTARTVEWPPPRPVDDLGNPHKVTRFLQIAPPLVPVFDP